MAAKKTTSKPKATKKSVKPTDSTEILRDAVVEGMQERKGKDIVCIDLREVKNAVSDFFVICHADSRTHIDSIARSIEETVHKKLKEDPIHVEGKSNAEWILLDFSTVVAHVFLQEKREFYGLERLWADADIVRIAGNY
ncbi:MAG: ribosome silencing factor [Bacteroidota bacterium]|jgi:ribosome-associated protein